MALPHSLSAEIKTMGDLNNQPECLFGSGNLFFKIGFRGWGLIQEVGLFDHLR